MLSKSPEIITYARSLVYKLINKSIWSLFPKHSSLHRWRFCPFWSARPSGEAAREIGRRKEKIPNTPCGFATRSCAPTLTKPPATQIKRFKFIVNRMTSLDSNRWILMNTILSNFSAINIGNRKLKAITRKNIINCAYCVTPPSATTQTD